MSACIGNRVCPFGNGCANDCIKARMHDFGIIGMTEPRYDPSRCISCGACVKGCDKLSVNALHQEKYKIIHNTEKCGMRLLCDEVSDTGI